MIVFAHIRGTKNVGDLACTPFHYFDFPGATLHNIDGDLPDCDVAIFGGGALQSRLVPPHRLQDRVNAKRKVAWGIGASRWGATTHPPAPTGFDLTGVREHGREGGTYVPCVTCMLPFFDAVPEPTEDIVGFFNADRKVKLPEVTGIPTLLNRATLDDTLAFLASGAAVVTNSYHGAYWALLMGRRVVCLPYSSKFHGFMCPPAMATEADWRDALPRAATYTDYLAHCRAANEAFCAAVRDLAA